MAEDYSKGTKTISTGSGIGLKASGSGGDSSGPTGSSRHYPKGKGSHMQTNWNPQKGSASTYGVNGV